ncbi:MAG: alkaline phosphatase [Melioribacteraceae bacterium]|nr:alkaline phosphatase [Melioribacteraceae bacterium]
MIFLIFTTIFAQDSLRTGNVIFIHPDGTGLSSWNATRIYFEGPDGMLNWDKIPNIGFYRSHFENSLTASSHAGATVHAYGVKVKQDSFGLNGTDTITARSGKQMSIMQEAMAAGIRVGIVNTGTIVEPGSAVFVASSESRRNKEKITKRVIESGADLILSGGEEWMLPKGMEGVHTDEGRRTDGINLIERAQELGYVVIYDKYQLEDLPRDVKKVLGVFAAHNTFNDRPEEELAELGLPLYKESAPSLLEMTKAAVEILSNHGEQFFLVAEEEATDNFANKNNAIGNLTAHKKADETLGYALDYVTKNPNTLLLTASDSEASGMDILGPPEGKYINRNENLAPADDNGAPVDGVGGTGTKPFISSPDKNGNTFPFAVLWTSYHDLYGSVIAKSAGLNSDLLKINNDNTEMYRIMYATLFGVYLD